MVNSGLPMIPIVSVARKRKKRGLMHSFFESTTIHGLNQVAVTSHWWKKLFWVAALLLCFALACAQLHSLCKYFMLNPNLTKISLKYPKKGLKFPPMTLCLLLKLNASRLNESYPGIARQMNLTDFSVSSFFSAYGTALMDTQYFKVNNANVDELAEQLEQNMNGKNLSEFYEDTSFTCRNMFRACWLENAFLFDCCNPNSLVHVRRHLLHSGACFEFVAAENIKQRLPGPVGGFGFVFWYPNQHIVQSAFNAYDEHAVHMFMSPADAMLEKNPVALPVGYHAHIALSASYISKTDSDSFTIRKLIPGLDEIVKNVWGDQVCKYPPLKYFGSSDYTYAKCQVECLIDSLLKLCNCTGTSMYAKIPVDKMCMPKEALKCYKKNAHNFTRILVKCRQQKCKEACRYWNFKASLTVGRTFNSLVEEQMMAYWQLHTLGGTPNKSLIIGDIYFDEIQYHEIRQVPALTFERFVSSIGGAMGLWTGASVITWVHLCFFLCSYFCGGEQEQKEAFNVLHMTSDDEDDDHHTTDNNGGRKLRRVSQGIQRMLHRKKSPTKTTDDGGKDGEIKTPQDVESSLGLMTQLPNGGD